MTPTASGFKGLKVDQSLDVRSTASPEGYHKAVAQLSIMKEHEVLELHIDEGESLEAIPFALRAEGHEILVSESVKDGVRLLVRKRALTT